MDRAHTRGDDGLETGIMGERLRPREDSVARAAARASMVRRKSASVSPLATEEVETCVMGTTVPPRRCMAAMKEQEVRVEGS